MTEQTHAKTALLTVKIVRTGLAYAQHVIQPSLRRQLRIRADVGLATTQLHQTSVPNVQHIVQCALTLQVSALNVQIPRLQSLQAFARATQLNI